jgi:hypothetical protein
VRSGTVTSSTASSVGVGAVSRLYSAGRKNTIRTSAADSAPTLAPVGSSRVTSTGAVISIREPSPASSTGAVIANWSLASFAPAM